MNKNDSTENQNANPTPEFIAGQLRNPSGPFAGSISKTMNQVNKPLYDLAFDVMDIKDHSHILEIGFGNGRYMQDLFASSENVSVCGIDISDEMIQEASELNADLITSGNLKLYSGSSDNLPFTDQAFDLVFCNMVIFFWDKPGEHLKEIRRVLRNDGKFFAGLRTKESMLKFPFVEHGFTLYEENEWANILTVNGFELIDAIYKADPEFDNDGKLIQLESVCWVARKCM